MPGLKQRVVRNRPGGDDTRHLPLHGALALGWVPHLLADGHGFAKAEEPRQVVFCSVVRDPSHGNGLAGGLAPGRQGDVKEFRGAPGVLVEQLVEVTHAIEEKHLPVLRLQSQILLHHGRMLGRCGHSNGA